MSSPIAMLAETGPRKIRRRTAVEMHGLALLHLSLQGLGLYIVFYLCRESFYHILPQELYTLIWVRGNLLPIIAEILTLNNYLQEHRRYMF